jgi:hypothetical protein
LQVSDSVSIADRLHPGRRGAIYETVIDAALRSPWVGYGWQQMPLAQLAAAQDHVPITYWLTSAHNLVLDLIVWNGIPIGLAVAGAATWWLVSRVRLCRDTATGALLVSLGILCVHSMLEFPLHYAYYLLPAGLMVGAIEARTRSDAKWPALHLPRLGFVFLWLSLSVSLGLVAAEYFKVEEATRRAGLRDVGLMSASEPAEAPDVVLLDGPREFIQMWLSEAREGMTPAELQWMHDVAYRYPVPPALFRYALAEGLNGRADEAQRTLDLLCRVASRKRCEEGRLNWGKAMEKFPCLRGIAFPDL